MKNNILISVLIFAFAVIQPTDVPAQGDPGARREITRISGDLYRVRNNAHYSVLLVTPDGIILGDPINTGAAKWLKEEIRKHFNIPVRYVIYSHHHGDHAGGGEVFADTATFVGHKNMLKALQPTPAGASLPANAKRLDKNNNGTLEKSETSGFLAASYHQMDRDNDGHVTGVEFINWTKQDVHAPDVTYKDRMTISLGGKTVELVYTGRNHTDDMTVVYFPAEKVVFAVDFINVRRLPFRMLDGTYYPDWIDSMKAVEQLDFDVFAPGHGEMGNKADIADHRQYVENLASLVAKGMAEGKSVEALQRSLTLDKYRSWAQYDAWRAENIAGMYRILSTEK